MSDSDGQGAAVIRAAEAEVLDSALGRIQLLAEPTTTHQCPHVHRTNLAMGTTAAGPHHHLRATELFFVLDGKLQVLLDEDLVTAERGDLIVVPPKVVHAYGAALDSEVDVLVLFTPGLPLFDFFRQFMEIVNSGRSPREMGPPPPEADMHADTSEVWKKARARREPDGPVRP
jgi:mannose-6-phosphate isomerase-like protein (cupin superfamily)